MSSTNGTNGTTSEMSNEKPDRPDHEEPTASEPEKPARFRPFGVTPASETAWDEPVEEKPAKMRHIVDRFDGALGLLLLRVAVAVIFGIRGLQKVQHVDVTQQQLIDLGIPYPETLALVMGIGQFAIAWLLLLGIAVRAAGLAVAVLAIGALVLGPWRYGDFFTAGAPGFNDELKLLLAGVGLALLGLGGGGWAVDRRFRRR